MLLLTTLGSYLEGIGVLVFRGLVDIGLVDDLFSSYVIRYWEKYESIELELRERFNVPQSGEWIEYRYDEVKKITLEQHPELRKKDILSP